MTYKNLLPIIIVILLASCTKKEFKPQSLVVCEGFENPIGLFDIEPSFSWKLPVSEGIKSQSDYRIVVASDPDLLPNQPDLWDSKEVNSDQSAWVRYNGKPLASRQKAYWQVMFRDQDGSSSAWSEVNHFELGLLANDDWKAKWISLPREEKVDTTKDGHFLYKPQYLKKDFNLSGKIEKARLFITSKGVFDAQINGLKVGKDVMTPGWTPYQKRIETLTYDVKEQLIDGANVIGIVLGEGWYTGRINRRQEQWVKKQLPKVICQLEVTYKDGSKEIILSGNDWRGTRNGPLRFSGIYDGEVYDANMEMPGWSSPGFDAGNWEAVVEEVLDANVNLKPKRHNTVKNIDTLAALTITEPEKGKFVFDLGQNMVGVPMLNIPVKKNQKVTIRFAEMLKQNGRMYTENYRSAKSTDYYLPKADEKITWRPKFTFHGFRYVELSGFDENMTPDLDWVKGIVQHSDFEKTGEFISSHKKLNQLQRNIQWGLKGNFFDIPTDCPQRDERLGWTGDAQVFAPTSIFINGVHAFWASWLQSVREEQFEDGWIPFTVPNVLGLNGSSGWADAATIIPWEIYFRTGDKEVLKENYEMMKRLVGFYSSKANEHIADVRSFRDWLQPYSKSDRKGDTPQDLIGTAYYARSIDMTIKAARVLGYENDVKEFENLLNVVRNAFENKFFDKQGKLTTTYQTQTGYLLALGFELLSNDMVEKALPHLIEEIEKAGKHLRTGFLGTPLLAPVLDKYGHTDLMYTLLFKETYPSWFYSINQGATTMWERWNSYTHSDGFGDVRMNSFNHYAYGAIGQWMYERIAGLSPLEPGYKKILIAPMPGGALEHASADYNSVYGKISSGWKKVNNGLELNITIPPNTTAQIVIPLEEGMTVHSNGEEIANLSGVTFIKQNANNMVLEVIPGTYRFQTLL